MLNNVLAVNFSDIFKTDFLENFSSFSITDSIISLTLSLAIGFLIYLVYAKTFSGVAYSKSFNISLVAMTVVTSLVILGITSNVILSLGMVGALSIVRFRSAIKDPIDIAYLFWAICEGILCGAGLIPLALLGAIVVSVILYVFSLRHEYSEPYLLIVRFSESKAEHEIEATAKKAVKKLHIKSKTITANTETEIIYEVRLVGERADFLDKIAKTNGVSYATLVSYDGNYSV
ncbi:MAG: DUF4956 domain-containing protein [Clostridia bacterium]|nr:DUF4956 domain-containing protein [Clostridia bacterium]